MSGLPEPTEPNDALDDPRMADLDADPALATAVLEIESHLATEGWDQPARLYALVDTARLAAEEPALSAALGLDAPAEAGSLTAVEQEHLDPAVPIEDVLTGITWPPGVDGCAAMVERLVLPPGSDAELPDDPDDQLAAAREHPDRQEVRIVAGVTRGGATYCALRMRSHDDDASVVGSIDLVPGLLGLLSATLDDDETEPARGPLEENP
ncbi:PPA1309 family protein [Nocardioides marinquilinus]|uniref:PPA1309 family protein n=1 Tax=Nocardioides marinquilinus TaxID=1210400 RepID=A0ABP9Q3I7_9ACTN